MVTGDLDMPLIFKSKGFTLVEMVVVITIVAILAAGAAPSFAIQRKRLLIVKTAQIYQIGLTLRCVEWHEILEMPCQTVLEPQQMGSIAS